MKLSDELISLRDPQTGQQINLVSIVTITEKHGRRFIHVGKCAKLHQDQKHRRVINPFASYEFMMNHLDVCQHLISNLLKRYAKIWTIPRILDVLIHLDQNLLKGASSEGMERFAEMVLSSGASDVRLWIGGNISDRDLRDGIFPKNVGTMLYKQSGLLRRW
ncbi:hypothetical protein [Ideonella paludis]|uniref:Uncharacterized protein n=1 Tax=Ideonella paludis TaxID=1233411 RepID=A0ABS5E312_9BURK|nr:hypothetical protein [Ideonella paludis]MBQ0937808.1 hypothetical protein [Ideonella paludis]